MERITRLAIGVLGTGGGILAAGLLLAAGSMLLEGGQQSLGIGLIMLSLYMMLLVHAFIITSKIKDLLEEKREREGAGSDSRVAK